jgi:hypothetical protein
LPELKRALGTDTDITVFRKLKQLGYFASYTHRGRFYTLPEIVHFDDRGLWSHEAVWFSRHGTLLATVEIFVNQSPNGYYAHELADALHAEVQQPLRQLLAQHRLTRTELESRFLYTAVEPVPRRLQISARRSAQAVPLAVNSAAVLASPNELKAAILLFYGLLDEQQRRLFAGLESIRLGHGGDTLLADFLGLDVHTVARGRQQLLEQNVVSGRTRRRGGGRTATEKKARHNRRSPWFARTRYRWRSHDRLMLVSPHYHHPRGRASQTRHCRLPQYRGSSAPCPGLFLANQPKADLHQLQSQPQSPVRISGRAAPPLPTPSSAHH